MDRREEIEKIIIGTLLNSDESMNYYENVRSCITADMLSDERDKALFRLISDMNSKGIVRTWPDAILDFDSSMPKELVVYMCGLAADYYFLAKKVEYNERVWMTDPNIHKRYTNVTFDDYISRFIKLTFKNV